MSDEPLQFPRNERVRTVWDDIADALIRTWPFPDEPFNPEDWKADDE